MLISYRILINREMNRIKKKCDRINFNVLTQMRRPSSIQGKSRIKSVAPILRYRQNYGVY